MTCPKPVLSGPEEREKNKVKLENECKESSDMEEKSFQASAKIYGSDNDVMGNLRIRHTSPVLNVHER